MKKNNTKLKTGQRKKNTIHYFLPWVQLPSAIAFNQLAANAAAAAHVSCPRRPASISLKEIDMVSGADLIGGTTSSLALAAVACAGEVQLPLCESDQEVHKMRL